jgi:hypothetical protein
LRTFLTSVSLAMALLLASSPLSAQTPPSQTPPAADAQQEPETPPTESPIISGMRTMIGAKAEEVDRKSKQVGELRFGSLKAGATASLSVDLDPKKAHLIVAACDFDCVAIDLKAFDQNEKLVAEHKGGGDMPTLAIKPGQATALKVTLTMTECREPACRAGIGVYQRSKP